MKVVLDKQVTDRLFSYTAYITGIAPWKYAVSLMRATDKKNEIIDDLYRTVGSDILALPKMEYKQMGADKEYHKFVHRMQGTQTTFVFAVEYKGDYAIIRLMENSALIKEDDELVKPILETKESSTEEKKYGYRQIVFITNDRNKYTNKTLNNLIEAVEEYNTELVTLVADQINVEWNGKECVISDSRNEIRFDESTDNSDILVISRLGAQGCDTAEYAIGIFEEYGFLVLNPLQPSKRASNKYQTSLLMSKENLPQPNYTLLKKLDVDDPDRFADKCSQIYDDWGKDTGNDDKKEFVIKILDGHGGTGVCLMDGGSMLSVLQAMFAVSPELQLLMQKKEDADGGDIRVHVLTLGYDQKIIGSMKRVKIDGDFRSNVSLGASAEKVKLTEEQEKIALKAAKVSGLPWCAVDIMPLKNGENVILEFNASPGTDGISEVLGKNFMSTLLEELLSGTDRHFPRKRAGFRERAKITIDGEEIELLAKLDTGNGAKASAIRVEKLEEKDGHAEFTFNGKDYKMKIQGESNANVGGEIMTRSFVTFPNLRIGNRSVSDVYFALDDKREKTTDILLNRATIKRLGLDVSAGSTHVLTEKMDKRTY